jgi:hypothetical protein
MKPSNQKTDKFASRRFLKEFELVWEEYDPEMNKKMNYYKTNEMLHVLGFMSGASGSEEKERILLYDFWKIIRGEANEGVTIDDMSLLLLAILGYSSITESKLECPFDEGTLFSSPTKKDDDQEGEYYSQAKFGFFNDQNKFSLYIGESSKVAKHFSFFSVNRTYFVGRDKKVKNYKTECTFKPAISETSNHLAENYRKKMAKEAGINDEEKPLTVMEVLTNPKESKVGQFKKVLD